MIKYILFLVFICCTLCLSSQELQLFSSGGGNVNSGELRGSFSIGETIINSSSFNEFSLTQGFHQAMLFVVGVKPLIVFDQLEIHPNPAQQHVDIQIPGFNKNWDLSLLDLQGNLLTYKTIPGTNYDQPYRLDISTLNPGFYVIRLTDKEFKNIYTGRIIKI
jgi:hypothetical protein